MRKIIHIDMDAFYASVEQLDHPEYRGKPLVVGGRPDSRGVVATASYEARKYGIKSAMPSSQAFRLCPIAIFVKPRIHRYKELSEKIRSLYFEFTDTIEIMGLDEAYLDVTTNKKNIPSATWVAEYIRKLIVAETKLTASAGVSFNKFLAKVASDINKPDGITVIGPKDAQEFIDKLPIEKFHGIGKSTAAKMAKLGIKTGVDLRKVPMETLSKQFGKAGIYYFKISRGQDDRPVVTTRIRKSVGAERTFSEDVVDYKQIMNILGDIGELLVKRLCAIPASGKTITIKVRYHTFETHTRSKTIGAYTNNETMIVSTAKDLFNNLTDHYRPIRLLGITVSNLDLHQTPFEKNQLELPFDQ